MVTNVSRNFNLIFFCIFVVTISSVGATGTTTTTTTDKCCPKPNESYTPFGPTCGGDGCVAITYITECKEFYNNSNCFCDCGYFRNAKGDCVKPDQCDKPLTNFEYSKSCPGKQCCGQFEYFTKGSKCGENCPPPNGIKELFVCPASEFQNGCYCLPGYKRNATGICVKEDQCPGTTTTTPCKKEENKVPGCDLCSTCENAKHVTIDQCKKQIESLLCKKDSCTCAPGYYSDSKGNCLTLEQCKTQNGGGGGGSSTCDSATQSKPNCDEECRTCDFVIKSWYNPHLKCEKTCGGVCVCNDKRLYLNSEKKCVPLFACWQDPGLIKPTGTN